MSTAVWLLSSTGYAVKQFCLLCYALLRLVMGYPLAYPLHWCGITADQVSYFRFYGSPPLIIFCYAAYGISWELFFTQACLAYTDLLDGILAELEGKPPNAKGVKIDSMADKVLVGCCYVPFVAIFPFVVAVTTIFELLNVRFAAKYEHLGREKIRPNIFGKAKFNVEISAAMLMTISAGGLYPIDPSWVNVIGLSAIAFLFASWLEKAKALKLL